MAKQPSTTCPICERTSYLLGDIANRYCGGCNLYYDEMVLPPPPWSVVRPPPGELRTEEEA